MDNNTANYIVDKYLEYKERVKYGDIVDFKLVWDDKNNTLDISVIPYRTVEFIHVDIRINNDGTVFNE